MATEQFNIVKIILDKSIFDENIIHIILNYYWKILDKPKVLLQWIDINNLKWGNLCSNPNAIDLLKNNKDKISWLALSRNPNAIDILENNLDKINRDQLSQNPNMIKLLENNQHIIRWDMLCINPNAIHLLEN